jgi:hypothetical protein
MAIKKEKGKVEKCPHWPEMIAVYFEFCRKKFNTDPDFTGSAPRDLKQIVMSLKKRAETNSVEWSLKTASMRLWSFLNYCYSDEWYKKHFLLHILNRHKNTIFFNIQQNKNETAKRAGENGGDYNAAGDEGNAPYTQGNFGQL